MHPAEKWIYIYYLAAGVGLIAIVAPFRWPRIASAMAAFTLMLSIELLCIRATPLTLVVRSASESLETAVHLETNDQSRQNGRMLCVLVSRWVGLLLVRCWFAPISGPDQRSHSYALRHFIIAS
jgi:hypothetical protein